MEVHHHPKARQSGKGKNKIEPYAKNLSYAHIA
jgi:hypothetical protein